MFHRAALCTTRTRRLGLRYVPSQSTQKPLEPASNRSLSCQQRRKGLRPIARIGEFLRLPILAGAILLSLIAGYTDLRSRRIPNWLTVPGFAVGVAASAVLGGWSGLKDSLLGTGLAFALLLPFWLLRSLGAGDLKFAAALGAYTGPGRLVDILIGSVFVAGIMALTLVIYKGRFLETIRNIGHILISLVTFRLPGSHVTIDNPNALTIPKGVALAVTVVLYGVLWKLRMVF